jgi:hypothetical protein
LIDVLSECVLPVVTFLAGKSQVVKSVGAMLGAGDDMVDCERDG